MEHMTIYSFDSFICPFKVSYSTKPYMAPSQFMKLLFLSLNFASLAIAFNVPPLSFDEGYSPLFGDNNVVKSPNGKGVKLLLTRYSGSGFISSDMYHHGFFSASIKLPSDYTAGVVVAFYTSNGDLFEKTHDELDFEFLGNIKGKEWRIQTNVYGNGSTSRGREERYLLPFDPTEEPHQYSILWTLNTIIFYIDDIPIREVIRSEAMGGDYPSKPMSLYATIWDGSTWATSGGRYKANYKYAPFIAEFSNLILKGCKTNPIQAYPTPSQCEESDDELSSSDFAIMTPRKRAMMKRFRERYMTYSFCYDELRYRERMPDCNVVEEEKARYWKSGDTKFIVEKGRRRRGKRSNKGARVRVGEGQVDV